MKTWQQIYSHVAAMKRANPKGVVARELFTTVVATAQAQNLVNALQRQIALHETQKRYASNASFVAEYEQKIAGCKELLAWIEE